MGIGTKWAASGLLAAIGLIGLLVSSQAEADGMLFGGLAIFLVAAGAIFWIIRRHFDAIEAAAKTPAAETEGQDAATPQRDRAL